MKKVQYSILLLLIISLILNVSLLTEQPNPQYSPSQASGLFELNVTQLRIVQYTIEEYLNATDQESKTSALFKLIEMSNGVYITTKDLNNTLLEVYGSTLPLERKIFDFKQFAYHIAMKSVEEKNISSQVQAMKKQVDTLLDFLDSHTFKDKKSFENTKTNLDEFLISNETLNLNLSY